MKVFNYLLAAVLVFTVSVPIESAFAQTAGKKSQSLPQAPITYPGDTDNTIARRAQWLEGAKKEGALVWWGIGNPSELKETIVAFNKVYPFIKVEYWRGRGEEIAAKLEAEHAGGRSTVDVCLGAAPENYPRWAKMGMLENFVGIVPMLGKFDKRMYGKRGDWVMPSFGPKTPQYNTNLISAAEAPKTWEDLLSPKWKGNLGVEVESENWATLALAEGGWGIEKTENFLTRLKEQGPRFIQGGNAAHSLLITGEYKVLAMANLRYILISKQKKAPVEWVAASPILVTGPSLTMQKLAPHPNAARLFLEWLLSPQGLLIAAEVSQNYSPGVPTPIAKLLEGKPLVVRTEEVQLKVAESGLMKKFNKLLFGIED